MLCGATIQSAERGHLGCPVLWRVFESRRPTHHQERCRPFHIGKDASGQRPLPNVNRAHLSSIEEVRVSSWPKSRHGNHPVSRNWTRNADDRQRFQFLEKAADSGCRARDRSKRKSPPRSERAGHFSSVNDEQSNLLRLEVGGRSFARATIGLDLVAHFLTVVEAGQASALNCRDMHENIRATLIGLDESIALLPVEPLHCTCRHDITPVEIPLITRINAGRESAAYPRDKKTSRPWANAAIVFINRLAAAACFRSSGLGSAHQNIAELPGIALVNVFGEQAGAAL